MNSDDKDDKDPFAAAVEEWENVTHVEAKFVASSLSEVDDHDNEQQPQQQQKQQPTGNNGINGDADHRRRQTNLVRFNHVLRLLRANAEPVHVIQLYKIYDYFFFSNNST